MSSSSVWKPRKRLVEYYTPDWLAGRMVDEVITDPLSMRVLDTACGSGTFLFHAVRKYVKTAEHGSAPLPNILDGDTSHVLGMDLHPVGVTLARVTYLLAIGKDRLTDPARGSIQIPVYLGDSIQWQEQQIDLWTAGNLFIHANDSRELFASDLRFPDKPLENAALFDQLIQELADRAAKRKPGDKVPVLAPYLSGWQSRKACSPPLRKPSRRCPGSSIGTLTVDGDINFAAGSTYEVEVDPGGTDSDLIHASGSATLNGGSVVHIGADGSYDPSSTYTILTADSGVTGTFEEVSSNFAFLDPTLAYYANNVFLELIRNDTEFEDVGETRNQIATGAAPRASGWAMMSLMRLCSSTRPRRGAPSTASPARSMPRPRPP